MRKHRGWFIVLLSCSLGMLGVSVFVFLVEREADGNIHSYDFGIAKSGAVIEHTFQLLNRTNHPLHPRVSSVSCGSCIAIQHMPKVIEAKKKGDITITYDTTGRKGYVEGGAVVKVDDADVKYHIFKFVGLISAIWVRPASLDNVIVADADEVRQEIYILGAGYADPQILRIDTPANISYVLRKPNDEEMRASRGSIIAVLQLRIKPAKQGFYTQNAEILIRTNVSDYSLVTVPLKLHVSNGVKCSPGVIIFGQIDEGKQIERVCNITMPFQISEEKLMIETHRRDVNCEVEQIDDRLLKMRVLYRPIRKEAVETIKGEITGKYEGTTVFSLPYLAYPAEPYNQRD